MQQDLNRVIEQVSKEKGIDKSILISALENAMVSAAKKTFGHQRKIEAQFNPEIGEVELFEAKTVVETIQDAAVEITLDEGRNRQIRRLLAALDIGVLRLIRVAIGPLPLGRLKKGEWRLLDEKEIEAL